MEPTTPKWINGTKGVPFTGVGSLEADILAINLAAMMQRVAGREVGVEFAPPRPGNVRDRLAATATAQAAFGFAPSVGLDEGLDEYMAWIAHDPVTLRRLTETRP
jgi:nucleoside-diphosphate-sugar epimerase